MTIKPHRHYCPSMPLHINSVVHKAHEWLCYRPNCDASEIYECGFMADAVARERHRYGYTFKKDKQHDKKDT